MPQEAQVSVYNLAKCAFLVYFVIVHFLFLSKFPSVDRHARRLCTCLLLKEGNVPRV